MQTSQQPTLFISDLHLDPSRPAVSALFLDFLRRHAGQVRALYILGDLFEAWIGDDAVSGEEPILRGMQAFAERTPLYLMHGNRDFLLGARFCQLTGAQLLEESTIVDLYGTRTLLMHGDQLCIDDLEYQRFRAMVRDPAWQAQFLGMPLPQRIEHARRARTESASRNQGLAEYLMDVNQGEVEKTLREQGVRRLIHGHTHRPDVHRFELNGKEHVRVVLGDWYEQGSVLTVSEQGLELQKLPLG